MHQIFHTLFSRSRDGFSLLDVALATVIITSGTLFVGAYFRNVYDKLDPRGSVGGLRRYLMAEQMLRAQAEGLRLLQVIPTDAGSCRLVAPPAGSGFTLNITQYAVPPAEANEYIRYFDLSMTHGGITVGTISMSTLRRIPETTDDKIGL